MDQAVQAVAGSGATQFFFDPVEYMGITLVDGGKKLAVDPENAILRCLEEVGDQSDIILDIINVAGKGFDVIEGTLPPNQTDGWLEISKVMDLYPTVQYRYLMAPSFDVLKGVSITETDHAKTDVILKQGLMDAKDVLA